MTFPTTEEEWNAVYRAALDIDEAAPAGKPLGIRIANVIVGDEYLKQIVDFLVKQLALQKWSVHRPIEAFLSAVSSPAVRRYLLELCLHSNNPDAVRTACILLPPLADMDLLPELPQFAQSNNVEVQRCGIAICLNLTFIAKDLISSRDMAIVANLFRGNTDEYIADKVRELDTVATTIRNKSEQ